MSSIKLQTTAMKTRQARKASAKRRHSAYPQPDLAVYEESQDTPSAHSISATKRRKRTIRIPGPKNVDSSAQAVIAAETKKFMIRIPVPKNVSPPAQIISAEKTEAKNLRLNQQNNHAPPSARMTSAPKHKITVAADNTSVDEGEHLEGEEDGERASLGLTRTPEWKPSRLRLTPGKPAVMV